MSKDEARTVTQEEHDVIIVGGGPVGLFLGLTLAQKGIDVLILEAEADIVPSPRALMYWPICLQEFQKAGILDEVVAAGFKNQEGLAFRTLASTSNKLLAKIPLRPNPRKAIDYGVQLGQHRLAAIIRKRAQQYPNLSIRYSTRFTTLQQEPDHVNIQATSTSDNTILHFRARFLAACDGASSPVRKTLNIPFEGYTWEDFRFLAINLRYDFAAHGYQGANQIIDAEDWAVIVRASSEDEGLWRIATGIRPDIPLEEIETQYLPGKLERLLPGPRPLEYELVACNPYWAQERVAARFREGRVVLCGDAAHVNNPLTALGLATGLIDVAILSRLLPQAFTPKTSPDWPTLLEKYATLRRQEFISRVQKQAVEGKLRVHSMEPTIVKQREVFFRMLRRNPGFGDFVAGTMMETLPERLEPGGGERVVKSVVQAWKKVGVVVMCTWWFIRASVPWL